MNKNHFKVINIGTGPSCLFSAIELVKEGITDILMLEAGKKYTYNEFGKSLTSQFGGNGLVSDGKQTIHHQVGTTELPNMIGIKQYYDYMNKVVEIYKNFKPTKEQREIIQGFKNDSNVELERFEPNDEALEFRANSLAHGLDLLTYAIVHLGSDSGFFIAENIYDYLIKNGVSILCENKVTKVSKKEDIFYVCVGEEVYTCNNLIVGVGRSGSDSFREFMKSLNIPIEDGYADLGLRIETSNSVTKKLMKAGIYEPKFIARTKTYEDKCRSFCWNYAGEVVAEKYPHYGDLVVANGHSLQYSKTDNTNFALLVTKKIPNPLDYLKNSCKQVNILANQNIMIQRVGDLREGRRSTQQRINEGGIIPTCDAYPGDLSLVLSYRTMLAILETLEMMDGVLPGINSKFSLLYGLECKFYTNIIKLNNNCESIELENLYAIGDGSGLSRGQVASSVMGLLAAEGILRKS
jgi:uncharacterized protein